MRKTKRISSGDLKTIIHSKRAKLYYLEYCRILVNGGRVEYVTERKKESLYWNIPIANTTTVLLGTGTSITQAAVRELARAGVMIGFCGGSGTPLFAGTEIEWIAPYSEYRPNEYMQKWVKFWFQDELRLQAAKKFQQKRIGFLREQWVRNKLLIDQEFNVDYVNITSITDQFVPLIISAKDVTELLAIEGRMTKILYGIASSTTKYGNFSRAKNGAGIDSANRFLDHGNYLAYGLAATACWVIGIPAGFAIMHGKTRRGGLVFDVADLVKDGLILPQSFISAMNGQEEQEFRQTCIDLLVHSEALDFMIDTLKEVANNFDEETVS